MTERDDPQKWGTDHEWRNVPGTCIQILASSGGPIGVFWMQHDPDCECRWSWIPTQEVRLNA